MRMGSLMSKDPSPFASPRSKGFSGSRQTSPSAGVRGIEEPSTPVMTFLTGATGFPRHDTKRSGLHPPRGTEFANSKQTRRMS